MKRRHRHRLLIYEALGKRLIIVACAILLGLLATIALDWFQPFLEEWRWVVTMLVPLTAVFIAIYLAVISFPSVTITSKEIAVRGPLKAFRIPIEDVVAVTPSKLSKHYPVANLRLSEFYRISGLYEAPCTHIEVRKYPFSALVRRLFPRFLFTPAGERPAVLLNVNDWLALSHQVEAAREAWLERDKPSAPSADARFLTAVQEAATISTPPGQPDAPLLLVIDDSPAQAATIQQAFVNTLRVVTAGDGINGLKLARQHKPDVIVMDIHLPRLGGREFILTMRKNKDLRTVPILLVAGEEERKQAAHVLVSGANDFLLRPFGLDELRYRVERWLAWREQERKMRRNNDLLRTKTLNQMAELVRQGELVNFLPATVAQEVMSGQISGKNESFKRQKVTVLFVDIVGFTDLTGRLDPKLLAELLNEYLREITAVAIAHNGTVDKFIGDAVMALFGAPQTQEERKQAWSAINAGLDMLKAIEHLNFIWESRIPRKLSVRIGINTGYCTTGVFGNEMLQSYTAVGSAVNIASRLQSVAEPNTLLCSRATFEHVQDRVFYREVGALSLKGVTHAVEGYEIMDVVKDNDPTPSEK